MTCQNVWNMSLFMHFFEVLDPDPYLSNKTWNPDPHKSDTVSRIRIRITLMRIRNTA
jgi:hypothetical protein